MEGSLDQNKLITLLLEERLLNKRQIKEALIEQGKTHRPLNEILLDMKLVTPAVISELQAKVMGMEHIRLTDIRVDGSLLKLLTKRYAIEHRAIPISLSGNTLTVAMERPQDVLVVDEIKMLTGYNIHAVVASPKDIQFALEQYPSDEWEESPAIKKTNHVIQAIQFMVFIFFLMIPLFMIVVIASFNNDFIVWLDDFSHIITYLLGWAFYAIILFYIYQLIIEATNNRGTKTPPKE